MLRQPRDSHATCLAARISLKAHTMLYARYLYNVIRALPEPLISPHRLTPAWWPLSNEDIWECSAVLLQAESLRGFVSRYPWL